MVSTWINLARVVERLTKLTCSNEPEWVRARAEMEQQYKQQFHEPFVAGREEKPLAAKPAHPSYPFILAQWVGESPLSSGILLGGALALLIWWFMK